MRPPSETAPLPNPLRDPTWVDARDADECRL